jgi:acyl-CoA synthetase (NDP forming)/RimJ/RimL family protein N-acetyltransferase
MADPSPGVDALLADGSTVRVRPIEPGDAGDLVRFHRALSSDLVRFRSFGSQFELSAAEVQRFMTADGHDRQVLVAVARGEIVGVARYDATTSGVQAEVSFVVADRFQGRGVGTLLLEHLADHAHQEGFASFSAEVLSTDSRTLRVLETAGFKARSKFLDGTVQVVLDLAPSSHGRQVMQAREHRAVVTSLTRVLRPRTVAVVGASRSPGNVGHEVARAILEGCFCGDVFLINRDSTEVLGYLAQGDVRDIDVPLDLAVVAVPANDVIDVVEAARERGAAGAVVLSDGFAETGPEGALLQAELLERARAWGVRVIGPNCLGIINTEPGVSLDATCAGIHPPAGPIGFYTQSGAVGIEALAEARLRRLGLASFVSVGNKADVSGNDMLHWWADDPDTTVIGMYLESFGNPVKFRRLARQLSARKPIVALKAARTEAGVRAATTSATGIAGSDRLVDALFQDAGVIRVASFEELFDTLGVLSTQPLPRGKRVAIVTNSGGAGVLAADALADVGLTMAADIGANPIDLWVDSRPDSYRSTIAKLLRHDAVDSVISIFVPTTVLQSNDVADSVEQATREHRDAVDTAKPVIGVFLAGAMPEAGHLSEAIGIDTSERAARALANAWSHHNWLENLRPPAEAPPGCDPTAARDVARAELARHGDAWLPSEACSRLLDAVGIDLVVGEVVTSGQAAGRAAERLGVPVAVKAVGSGIVHKSDIGGVVLDVATPEEAARAYERLVQRVGIRLEGALVQPMAGRGEEVVIGAVRDPSFGALVLFGAGGTRTEIAADRTFRLSPFNVGDADEMIASTRLNRVLDGWRGDPRLDRAGLEVMLERVAYLVDLVPEVAEVDLNPVIVGQHRCWVVDARVRLAPAPTPLDALRRLR